MVNEWFDIICNSADECRIGCPGWGKVAIPEDPDCCLETELGQICGLYFDPCCKNPIGDWSAEKILAWASIIDNSDTTATNVKYVVVEGSIPKAEKVTVSLPKGKTKTVKKIYTVTAKVKCIGDGINDFMRNVEKGNTNFKFWYESLGGYFYGGNNGISPTSADADKIHEEDATSVSYWEVVLTFEACTNPPRIANPLV